jgi:hypothetical protein
METVTAVQTGGSRCACGMPLLSIGQRAERARMSRKYASAVSRGENPWAGPEMIAAPPQAAQGTNDPVSLIRRRRIGESAIPAMIRPMKPSSKVPTRGGDQHDHVHHVLRSGIVVRVLKRPLRPCLTRSGQTTL